MPVGKGAVWFRHYLITHKCGNERAVFFITFFRRMAKMFAILVLPCVCCRDDRVKDMTFPLKVVF